MRWTVGLKIGGGYFITLIVLIMVGVIAYQSTVALLDAAARRQHSHNVLTNIELMLSALKDAETGQRGFIITGKDSYLEPYSAAVGTPDHPGTVMQNIAIIKGLVGENPVLNDLERNAQSKLNELAKTIVVRRDTGFEAAQTIISNDIGKQYMDNVRTDVGKLEDAEKAAMQAAATESENRANITKEVIVGGTLIAILLKVIIATLIVRNISIPLGQITDAAERISTGDLSADIPPLNRGDEVATLTKTFIRMTHSLRATVNVVEHIAAGDLRATITPQSEKDALGNALCDHGAEPAPAHGRDFRGRQCTQFLCHRNCRLDHAACRQHQRIRHCGHRNHDHRGRSQTDYACGQPEGPARVRSRTECRTNCTNR